jgi:hypothetical protein
VSNRERIKQGELTTEFVTPRSSVHVLRLNYPNRPSVPQAVSVHRGIVIVWDEDFDSRIIDFVNSMSEDALAYVHWVGESKGSLSIGLCTGSVVAEVAAMLGAKPDDGLEVCGDYWPFFWFNSTTGESVTGAMA